MESITAEIPGYYFDHKLKRYFKIQSPIERERYGVSVDERRSKKPEEREEGSDNNVVKLIRNRASELNYIHRYVSVCLYLCPDPIPFIQSII